MEIPMIFRDPGSDDRLEAKDRCFEYNNTRPSDIAKREDIIRKLFGSIGKTFRVQSPFQCDRGTNIHAGNNLFINHFCTILDECDVFIGNNVMIGPYCGIYAASHPIDATERMDGVEAGSRITIGSDVWIGGNVSILSGVTIGDNVVIGAGSVVNRDIPPNSVAAGNPCAVIRRIP